MSNIGWKAQVCGSRQGAAVSLGCTGVKLLILEHVIGDTCEEKLCTSIKEQLSK